MNALIDVKNLMKIYNPGENEVRALDDVSFQVEEGEFVAIVGHSGSGKSTLMNMLGCLDVPTSGSYFLHGTDVSSMTDDELSDVRNKEIGFIFQGFNLIPNLTAIENVELPLIYRNVPAKERQELAVKSLSQVGLEKRMDHKPAEMSGGQQQRVAIARALAAKPPLILADEPTGNLDSKSSREIMEILKSLNDEGRTVVLITHDDGIAASAKRIVRIMDGQIESDVRNTPTDTGLKTGGTEAEITADDGLKAGSTETEITADDGLKAGSAEAEITAGDGLKAGSTEAEITADDGLKAGSINTDMDDRKGKEGE